MRTILEGLEINAKENGTKQALTYRNRTYTYEELEGITAYVAWSLLQSGFSKGDVVGITADHSDYTYIALLGILRAGGVYLPLNLSYPQERLEFMRQDAKVKRVLDKEDIRNFCRDYENQGSISQIQSGLPKITGDDPFAIIYTSGSTGTPKAVLLLHRNPMPFARQYIHMTKLTSQDRVTQFASLSFGLHISDLASAMLTGACLHILPNETLYDIKLLGDYFQNQQITGAILPTAMGRKLAENVELPNLRTLTVAGEKLLPFQKANPALQLFNAYGFTECAGPITMGLVEEGEEITVGKVSPGLSGFILGEDGKEQAKGEPGEFCISGESICAGYLHQPGVELYHSGDICRFNEMGNLIIIGRKDFQIKLRGYRIEPGEIETKMLEIPGITEAVVVLREGVLSCYYAANKEIPLSKIKEHLNKTLTPYMIPGAFCKLEKLPRNNSNKIDRSQLPLLTQLPMSDRVDEIPKGTTQKRLLKIWETILDRKDMGIKESFSSMGGDSLRAAILSMEIEKEFHILVPPAMLLPISLAEQAKLIEGHDKYRGIFVFRSSGSYLPLFFVHSANTGSEAYRLLAKEFSKEQPFFAFEHYNLIFHKELNIQELAKLYVSYLKELRPTGPYLLGGWSFGGLVAYEMARILTEAGDEEIALFLIDPSILTSDEEIAINRKLINSPYYGNYLRKDPWFEKYRKDGLLDRLIINNASIQKQVSQYKPQSKLSVPTVLFKMTEPEPISYQEAEDPQTQLAERLFQLSRDKADNGFAPYVQPLKVIPVASSHDQCLIQQFSVHQIAAEIENNQAMLKHIWQNGQTKHDRSNLIIQKEKGTE
jgi:amino acid adenylation domain-containing protein